MNLKDKVIVITGSSRGFGKTLAEAFLKEEAKIVINSSDKNKIENLAKEMGVLGVYADVTKEEELINLSEKVINELGKIDIWINNAGLWIPHDFVENFDIDKVKKMFDVNVIGTINGTRVALRYMKKRGTGMIINIISDSALAERPMSSAYCATKWAVNGLTKSVRKENEGKVSVLSVFPGGMKTGLFGDSKPDNFSGFMEPEFVVDKMIENLKEEKPQEELIVQK